MKMEIEWLETDGLGGFAMGTPSLTPRRRYHSFLTSALTPPTQRMCLVNTCEVNVVYDGQRFCLSNFEFGSEKKSNHTHPHKTAFVCEHWPVWTYTFPELNLEIEQQFLMIKDQPLGLFIWKQTRGDKNALLEVRPLISVRDQHALHLANDVFNFQSLSIQNGISWTPYAGCPSIHSRHNGSYRHEPLWFYNFFYSEDQARGFDAIEDLASPGIFAWELAQGEAYLLFESDLNGSTSSCTQTATIDNTYFEQLIRQEHRRRASFPSPLHKAADAYIVKRGQGKSIIAGYPWFTDWGRDTFIAFRGICLSTKRLEEGASILSAWCEALSAGMIPNRFPDTGGVVEYNSVDAALWFIVSAQAFIKATPRKFKELKEELKEAIVAIIDAHIEGTRFGIKVDEDGLLKCGLPGTQLTWMDAKIGPTVFTPRSGKPVEIQALWINSLIIAARYRKKWKKLAEQAQQSFREKFWNADLGYLYDVIDIDHIKGTYDASLRPNQLFAIGGLPEQLLDLDQARSVVEICEKKLLTPYGLRTLSPDDHRFKPRYEGNGYERDSAYHQGTVWPWLLGAFVEAWVRVQKDPERAKNTAKKKFLRELLSSLLVTDGIGHLSEIHDATAPFQGRGCPFQAWSVAEALRLFYEVLHSAHDKSAHDKSAHDN